MNVFGWTKSEIHAIRYNSAFKKEGDSNIDKPWGHFIKQSKPLLKKKHCMIPCVRDTRNKHSHGSREWNTAVNRSCYLTCRRFQTCKKEKDGDNSHPITRMHLIPLNCSQHSKFHVRLLDLTDETQKNITMLTKQVTTHEDQEKKKRFEKQGFQVNTT